MSKKRLFCFGFGYTSDHLETYLRQQDGGQDWDVWGTTGEVEKEEKYMDRDVSLVIADEHRAIPDIATLLKGTTHILISVPPENLGCPIFRSYVRDIVSLDTIEWIGYLSTTAVYGNRYGAWVDESAEVRPTTIRGSRRAKAEEQWMSLFRRYDAPVHIFRLAGIYGVGRSAIDSMNVGMTRRIYKEDHVFNRTHIDDLVQVLHASMHKKNSGAVYNVVDDEPAPSHEVIGEAASLLDMDEPPLVDIEYANLAPITASFYSDNKRVRNDRIKEELGVVLKCPTYREGLRACLDNQESGK